MPPRITFAFCSYMAVFVGKISESRIAGSKCCAFFQLARGHQLTLHGGGAIERSPTGWRGVLDDTAVPTGVGSDSWAFANITGGRRHWPEVFHSHFPSQEYS